MSNKKSLYMQIKNKLKKRIIEGEFNPGDKIPSERELCEEFDVSRITVRRAIQEAINEGILFTIQGKGTFVNETSKEETKIDQELSRVTSFERTIANKGLKAKTKIINYDVVQADMVLSRMLELEVNDPISKLSLLGLADEKPFVLYCSYFNESIGKKFYKIANEKEKNKEAFSTVDIYSEIKEIETSFVEQTLESISADEYLAKSLQVEKDYPLFRICSVVFNKDNMPIEYKRAYYRSDKYKFHVRRKI